MEHTQTLPIKLYIIGNGFDIHHGINSSYSNFREWMSENHPDTMNRVDEIYGSCTEEWWCDFENQLASLDALNYGETIACQNEPDLASEHCDRMWNDAEIEVEQALGSLLSDLRECFHLWIEQLNNPQSSQTIKIENTNSCFLNFNYTRTLETLYGINPQKILYIHGCVGRDEEFILGHGKTYKELSMMNQESTPEPPEDLPVDELERFYKENADSHMLHEQLAVDAAINGVASQRKPVEKLIKKHESFFRKLSEVNEIYVFGLSLSDVDLPYLAHINSCCKEGTLWVFSDYRNRNAERIHSFCSLNNIKNMRIIELKELRYNRQLEIIFPE